jgi:hypothetical protein
MSNGTQNIEFRFWDLSSFYNPQTVFLLYNDPSNKWALRVIKYLVSNRDSVISDNSKSVKDTLIQNLNLKQYWQLPSQSELSNGDNFGCVDGNTILLEMSDSIRYKYILFRCPDIHAAKDSAFYWINQLGSRLRNIETENIRR